MGTAQSRHFSTFSRLPRRQLSLQYTSSGHWVTFPKKHLKKGVGLHGLFFLPSSPAFGCPPGGRIWWLRLQHQPVTLRKEATSWSWQGRRTERAWVLGDGDLLTQPHTASLQTCLFKWRKNKVLSCLSLCYFWLLLLASDPDPNWQMPLRILGGRVGVEIQTAWLSTPHACP